MTPKTPIWTEMTSPGNWPRVRYNDSVNEIFEPKMLIEVRDYLISSGNFFEMN